MTVRLAVFREHRDGPPVPLIDKSLHVFGERTRAEGAAPKPFQELPITYERAYGGVGFPDNPVGTGAAPDARTLPNVVHPANPRQPAGFGPISKRWASRRRLLGGSAPALVERQGAQIPDEFDWRYFHAAPANQQCDFFRGDESIVLDGMHPTLARVQTRLPSVQAQARWLPSGSRPAQGLPLRLFSDTLVIDAERRLCSLLWRGCLTLPTADARAGIVVYAGLDIPGYPIVWPEGIPEHLSYAEPASSAAATEIEDLSTVQRSPALAAGEAIPASPILVEEATQLFTVTPAPSRAAPAALPFTKAAPSDTGPRFPPPPPSKPRADFGATAPLDVVSPFATALPFGTTAPPSAVTPSTAALPFGVTAPPGAVSPFAAALPFKTAGPAPPSSPGHVGPAGFSPPPRPLDEEAEDQTRTVDVAAMEAQRRARAAPFALAEPGSKAPPTTAEIPGAPWISGPAAARAPLPSEDLELETFVGPVEELGDAAPPAPPEAAAPVEDGDGDQDAPAVAPAPPTESDLRAALRATVQARLAAREPLLDLDLAGADLEGVDFGGAALGGVNLSRARLIGCKLARAQLAGADLTGADLTGADLDHADLSRATLARAVFDGAVLADANLSGAQGPGASFARAKAARATFARGCWDAASFAGAEATQADFTASSLAGAHFSGASLAEASFADARGASAIFDKARLARVRAAGASFAGASFRDVDAPGSIWDKATLDLASFAGGGLKDANLSRASCLKTSFAGAELGGANLQRLTGDGADFQDSRLEGADLRQARLREATFDRAKLRGAAAGKADLARSTFLRADLQGAILRGARLAGASFVHATLEGTDLQDADFEGANVFGASRETAKLGAGARGLIEVDPGQTQS